MRPGRSITIHHSEQSGTQSGLIFLPAHQERVLGTLGEDLCTRSVVPDSECTCCQCDSECTCKLVHEKCSIYLTVSVRVVSVTVSVRVS